MTKLLLHSLGANMHVRFTNYVSIFPAINYCIQDLHVMSIVIFLSMHIFSYNISRMLFELTIRKLSIIVQSIKKKIGVMRALDITISFFKSTKNFRFPQKLPLRQIKFYMSPLLSDRFLKSRSSIRHNMIIVIRKLNRI